MSFILTKTPLRVSLLGGGTDVLRASSDVEWDCTFVGFTIDKYIYISSTEYPGFLQKSIRLLYSQVEEVETVSEIEHPVFREVLKRYNISRKNFMVSSDIPGGSGLGSSSAFTIGLLANCLKIKGIERDNISLAEEAIEFEQDVLDENVGVQDQILCSLGGLTLVDYNNKHGIEILKNRVLASISKELSGGSFLVYTGNLRRSTNLQAPLSNKLDDRTKEYREICRYHSRLFKKRLRCTGQLSAPELFESFVRPSWDAKKRYMSDREENLNSIRMSEELDKHGLTSHKLCGSGGGGFIYVWCKNDDEKERLFTMFRSKYILPISVSSSRQASVDLGLA